MEGQCTPFLGNPAHKEQAGLSLEGLKEAHGRIAKTYEINSPKSFFGSQ